MRHRARRDENHAEVVAALRAIGCSVLDLASIGGGCPDLLAAKNGRSVLLEVKDGSKPPSARKLTEDELKFHGSWLGPIAVVDSVDSAIRAVQGAT